MAGSPGCKGRTWAADLGEGHDGSLERGEEGRRSSLSLESPVHPELALLLAYRV